MSIELDRDAAIARLRDAAGPLTPVRSLDQLEESQRSWLASLDLMQATPVLVDLVLHPPNEAELGPAYREDFDLTVSEVLWTLGARDPAAYLRTIAPLLADPAHRAVEIELVGELASEQGLPRLAEIGRHPDLSRKERDLLDGALTEIGGHRADALRAELTGAPPEA